MFKTGLVNNDDCIFKPIWNIISWVTKKCFWLNYFAICLNELIWIFTQKQIEKQDRQNWKFDKIKNSTKLKIQQNWKFDKIKNSAELKI